MREIVQDSICALLGQCNAPPMSFEFFKSSRSHNPFAMSGKPNPALRTCRRKRRPKVKRAMKGLDIRARKLAKERLPERLAGEGCRDYRDL